ncbi:hypothetical protein [Aquiflexum sp.]|uniref:hypothetical protein n=1 Tax=Aquiflexum sp. TaxID=1872584 RepID=UPI003592EAB8
MKQTLQTLQLRQLIRLAMIFFIVISFNSNLFGQTKSDTLLIEETVLNYLEGLHDNDASRVEKAMHPELAKRLGTGGYLIII